jgi:hypothetical protein
MQEMLEDPEVNPNTYHQAVAVAAEPLAESVAEPEVVEELYF